MSDASPSSDRPRISADEKDRSPLRDVIDRMDRAREHIAKADPQLSETIRLLADRADKPGLIDQQNYRTRVAYALMDVEKLAGPVSNMSEPLRREMTRLGTSVYGLQNDRLVELMRMTPTIQDSGLVRDIRITATDAAQRLSQTVAAVQDRVESLESRVRLTGNAGAPSVGSLGETQPGGVRTPNSSPTTGSPLPSAPAPAPVVSALPPDEGPIRAVNRQDERRELQGSVRVGATGMVSSIMSAMNSHVKSGAAQGSLDPTPTPLADRVSKYEQRLQEGRDENTFRGAEQSGRAATEAMQAFANGPGAGVMNKIRDAAKADPAGMAGVMSEMRAGGVYADLRTQFDGAMQKEKGFAAAYDRAASAVGTFAKDRMAVDAIAAQRPDVDALTSRFQKLDAQIGKAAEETPGRKEGTSALEELAAKAAEILSRSVEKVRAAFSPAARTSSGASPSP